MISDLWKELAEGRKAEIERLLDEIERLVKSNAEFRDMNRALRAERDELLAALKRIEAMADKQGPMAALGDMYQAADVARAAIAKAERGK